VVLKDLLSSGGVPISMDEILWANENSNQLPAKAFAITFDDGFLNNKIVAAEILVDLKIPATFYVTTSFIENNDMSWIDRIEFAVETTQKLEIDVNPLGKFKLITAENKVEFLEFIRHEVKKRADINPNQLADEIQNFLLGSSQFGSEEELYKKMNWNDLRNLNANEFFSVGGHTHTHPILTHIDGNSLDFEIGHCLDLLAKMSDLDTHHFSYPEGQENCFNKTVSSRLKDFGVKICPSAMHGVNFQQSDLFSLKRVNVT
jgi:peptidoglycan/xylan/chitin deacetylase (PgdA/CDA1 family)